jgi:endoglucanase
MHFFKKFFILLFIFTISFSCKKNKKQGGDNTTVIANTFLHRSGKLIVDGNNQTVQLKGVAFGNEVWSDKEIPNTHHTEEDFRRVKEMNMNVIRFYMNYKTFENDNTPYQYKQAGWDWLNQNITWAKKYGVYLILNMHVPQGGFQSQGNGDALWSNTEYQNRLTALWKAIADKYKDEPQVIGFGLVNEPVPTSSKQQWQQLAQRIADEIRKADKRHILFIEKPIYVKGLNTEDVDFNFPAINDDNTVYEFHIYDPFQYTHQLFTWAGVGDGGKYPDESIVSYTNGTWYTGTFNNPNINAGSTDWTFFEGVKYKITDPKIKIGAPALIGANVSAGGKVYFDDIIIKEYDPNGNFIQDIVTTSADDLNGWSYWSQNNTGTNGLAAIGHSNDKSLYIENATADCNVSNYIKLFAPKQNYSYQINGWMKGENVAAAAACKLRIDFTTTNDPILSRNKQLLETTLSKYFNWANIKNVPLYMGEFGAGINCFQNNKGGLQWVTDMIDIAKTNNLHFTYHVYHEDNFGLYFGYGTLPDPSNVNQPLIDLFKNKLR